jgi:hypothetical protein
VRRALPPLVIALLAARPAVAQDPFEIQVYDAETAPVLHPGLEVHLNYAPVVQGAASSPVTSGVFHATFEPHLGVARWAEVGAYVQTAVRPDGGYEFAGVKVRFKARVPRRLGAGVVGLALNGELDWLPRFWGEGVRFGGELRPILDVRAGRFYASVNPILAFDFEGPLAGRPQLEPCAKVALDLVPETFSVGAEYYAGLGPIEAPFAASQQTHRLFGAADVEVETRFTRLSVNLGAGAGLAAGERFIVKAIIGIELGPTR